MTRSRSTTRRSGGEGLGDEAALEIEIFPVVLVALEGQKLQPAKVGLGAVEQATVVGHLLEEERIGVIQDRQVDLPVGEHALEVVVQLRVEPN